jgi:hypothetical protein
MERISINVFLILLTLFITCCSKNRFIESEINRNKSVLDKVYKEADLFSFIGSSYKSLELRYSLSLPPSCPPEFECVAQFGEYHYIFKFSDKTPLDLPSYNDKISYFKEDNFILNQVDFRKGTLECNKCNVANSGSNLPMPYFESLDQGWEGSFPTDLEVYIVDAKPVDLWIEKCNEKRPETLGDWSNGYSKGYAISEDQNLIIFWVLIW